MSEWVQIVSTVGFPIAACVAMAWYIAKVIDRKFEHVEVRLDNLETLMRSDNNDKRET